MGRPVIAITLGDVAGIGPEVIRKALLSPQLDRRFCYEVVLERHAPKVPLGRISIRAGRFALESLEAGVAGCLRGDYAALVTGPVHKAGLRLVGFRFPDQTNWLAHRTRAKRFAMMLAGKSFRVTLVTSHIPLRKVRSHLNRENIGTAIALTQEGLQRMGIRRPRILVAALNPHGGVREEAGLEEKRYIAPAIAAARRKFGPNITGPYTPDHVFRMAAIGLGDAVVCMYHDQGLIPFKLLAFEHGVNHTLGLPILRTSPDHGTAYDIAGKNRADPQSMVEAIRLATQLAAQTMKLETSSRLPSEIANFSSNC